MGTKWAELHSPEQPAQDFARQVLIERMAVVESLLPLAAHHHHEDVEHVHQLRVGCRRASAALRAFEPLFTSKPKGVRKWLKRIRDAAGPARDIDVLLGRFSSESSNDGVTEYALERLEAERRDAQAKLVQVARKASRGKLVESVEKCLQVLAKDSDATAKIDSRELGRFALRIASNAFLPLADLSNPTLTEMHQLRITGKRLRYSIEIFHAAFPSALREEVYPVIESLQDRLGLINDHATAQKLFQTWLAPMEANSLAAELARRIVLEHKEARRLRKRFLKWWTGDRVAELENQLEEFTREANPLR